MILPLKATLPERGVSIPAMQRMSEDLPAPFAPTMATISPLPTSRLTSESACASP